MDGEQDGRELGQTSVEEFGHEMSLSGKGVTKCSDVRKLRRVVRYKYNYEVNEGKFWKDIYEWKGGERKKMELVRNLVGERDEMDERKNIDKNSEERSDEIYVSGNDAAKEMDEVEGDDVGESDVLQDGAINYPATREILKKKSISRKNGITRPDMKRAKQRRKRRERVEASQSRLRDYAGRKK